MKTQTIAAAFAALASVAGIACSTLAQAQSIEAQPESSAPAEPAATPEAQAAPESSGQPESATETSATSEPAAASGDAAAPSAGEAAPPADATTEPPLETIPVAQPAPAAPAPLAEPQQNTLDDIVVTAQRKKEKAQEVPISVTVFNDKQIANANMTNSADIATYTPSLSTNQRFGPENASFAIRGFVQDLRTTASVGTYFAEVVAPRGQSSQTSGDGAGPGALFDLESIQVLKGPQGTLFGRNTTGGAVLLVPNKPVDAFGGYAEVSAGNFNARREQVIVNVPVTDWFRVRLGIDNNERLGVLNNTLHIGADDLGNVNYTAARLSAVLDLTESLENYTIVSYVDSETHGYTSQLFACNSVGPMNPISVFTGPGCQDQLRRDAAAGNTGYYDIESPIKTPITAIKERRAINTTTWRVSDDVSIKNIVAYAHLLTRNGSSIFGTHFIESGAGLSASFSGLAAAVTGSGLPITVPTLPGTPAADPRREYSVGVSLVSPTEPVTSQKTWIEEIQLQGESFDHRLSWQGGAYYEHSLPDGFSGNNSASLLSCELATIENPDPAQYNCFDALNGQIGSVLVQEYKTRYLNRAVYAQAKYDIFEQLSLTGGLRYTKDSTTGYGVKTRYTFAGSVEQAPLVSTLTPRSESKAPTGVIDLDYKPFNDVLTYAKYTRGYRQGSVVLAADPGIDTFKPEKVNTYEVGLKTQFRGWVAGRFNVAAFYNDFTNQQLQLGYISPTSGTTTTIVNAGKSRIAGVEAEAYLRMFDDLSLNLSYSHLATRLLEQKNQCADIQAAAGPVAGATCTPIADVGDELPFAADNSYVASLEYKLPLPSSIGNVGLGATYAYTGNRRAAASSSTPYDVLEPFAILNLNLQWGYIFGLPLDLSLFGTNVLDKEYATYISGTYNVLGFETRLDGLPRMLGARLRYTFGSE